MGGPCTQVPACDVAPSLVKGKACRDIMQGILQHFRVKSLRPDRFVHFHSSAGVKTSSLYIPSNGRKMTASVTAFPSNIPINFPDSLTEEQLWSFKPFKVPSLLILPIKTTELDPRIHGSSKSDPLTAPLQNWFDKLNCSLELQGKDKSHPFHPDPYSIKEITVQAYDLFGGSRIGFMKVTSTIANSAGEWLPGAVFLRGPSVAMLVMLIPDDTPPNPTDGDEDERYVVMTVQPRIAASSLAFAELPAGMVDDEGSFAGVAAMEIREELGMEIKEDELMCLSELAGGARDVDSEAQASQGQDGGRREGLPHAMFPSAGGCDEYITIYAHERRIPRHQLQEWNGRLTGLRDHGEKITLKLVPMRDLWREGSRDGKCLAALALWEGLKREGKI
jgi:ADP-sugar diphosphatase